MAYSVQLTNKTYSWGNPPMEEGVCAEGEKV